MSSLGPISAQSASPIQETLCSGNSVSFFILRVQYLQWDSNPHFTDFKSVSSTYWDMEAITGHSILSFKISSRYQRHLERRLSADLAIPCAVVC